MLASLFDAQMFAVRGLEPDLLLEKRAAIQAGLVKLFDQDTFRASIDAATNTPRLFRTRITLMREMVQDAIEA